MKVSYTATKISCYIGYFIQAIVNNLLPILFIALQNVYGLSYERLARIILVNFTVQMITDLCTPKIIKLMGYKKAVVMANAAAAVGLVMLSVLPNIMANTYLAILISVAVTACGSGLIEVVISPMVEMLPTKNKVGNMSVLHSFYCWGQAITVVATTFLVLAFGFKGWTFIPLVWAAVPFLNMFFFLPCPVVEPDENQKHDSFKKLIKSRKFRCYLIMMLCAGASEIAMAQWASMFAQQSLRVSKTIGDLTGPCAFAILMGTGRIIYAAFSKRIDFKKLLIVLGLMCFVCYTVVAVCNIPVISLIFCALCGLTVSVFWPGIYSAGAADFPLGAAIMFSSFAMFGDTGCSVGPWVIGIVADKVGLNMGLLTASVFPLILVVTTIILIKSKDE